MRFIGLCALKCLSVAGCLALSGCENFRESFGLQKESPDEFSEAPIHHELVLPPHFDVLPSPKGADPFPAHQKSTVKNTLKTPGDKALIDALEVQKPQRDS